MSEEMPLSYTVERAKNELRELGVSEEKIEEWQYLGITKDRPECVKWKSFGAEYKDENGYHYICYCPKCKKLALTDRCACMCGSCRKCGYRWFCMPPLDLSTFVPKFNLQDIVNAQPLEKDYSI